MATLPILVTGSKGFLGSAVTRILDDLSMPWEAFSGNVCRYEDFLNYPDSRSILHLAAKISVGRDERFDLFDTNVTGAYNAVRFACSQKGNFFLASTCCYEPKAPIPTPESAPLYPYSAYARSKICAEKLVQEFSEEFQLKGCIFRLFNLYGPHQPTGFVVSDYLAKLPAEKLMISNPDAVRDFIHLNDAGRLIARALASDLPGMQCVNVGTGVGHSVKQLVTTMCKAMGIEPTFEFSERPMQIAKSIADISRAESLFGWSPEVSLEEGIAQTVSAKGKQRPDTP